MAKSSQITTIISAENSLELESFASSSSKELDQAIQKKNDDFTGGQILECSHGDSFPWRDISYFKGKDADCVYFADISCWKRNMPDITLHEGGAEGPIAAVSHFRFNYRRIRVGVGADEFTQRWIEMPRKGVCNWTQRFEWAGKTYALSRIRKRECESFGLKPALGGHLKMEEEVSGKLVAVDVCGGMSRTKRGQLKLANGLSKELEVLVVIAIATWREIHRRM